MILMKAPYSGFNGYQSFDEGDHVPVSPELARRMLADGGDMVNIQHETVPLETAARVARLTLDDLPEAGVRDERQQQLAAFIS